MIVPRVFRIMVPVARPGPVVMLLMGGGTQPASKGSDMPKPTIVLVHGAWADGSSWNAVSTELQVKASPS